MMVDVFLLPSHLPKQSLHGKCVVVIDVVRATTTIASAFAAGIRSVHAFGDYDLAKAAAAAAMPRPLLCGELNALPPPGADLGNSPRQFKPEHAGRDVFLATTNGTRAMIAAQSASALLAGALVNAAPVAQAAADTRIDVILLCSGSSGNIDLTDICGAGAIASYLLPKGYQPATDTARLSLQLFNANKNTLPAVFRDTRAGRNVIRAGLEPDLDFAASVDTINQVGVIDPKTLVIEPRR